MNWFILCLLHNNIYPPLTASELHELVFSVKQRNLDLLPDLVRQVSAPRYERPHYTREEVAAVTANPEGTAAIVRFLRERGGARLISIEPGNYGEHISATAPVSVWSEILRAEFKVVEARDGRDPVNTARRVIRAVNYSLPAEVATHVDFVRNIVHVLPVPIDFSSISKKKLSAGGIIMDIDIC